jgi:hypothetical protein
LRNRYHENSGAPEAGVCLRNLNHNKDKTSAESGTSAPYQAATGDKRLYGNAEGVSEELLLG